MIRVSYCSVDYVFLCRKPFWMAKINDFMYQGIGQNKMQTADRRPGKQAKCRVQTKYKTQTYKKNEVRTRCNISQN